MFVVVPRNTGLSIVGAGFALAGVGLAVGAPGLELRVLGGLVSTVGVLLLFLGDRSPDRVKTLGEAVEEGTMANLRAEVEALTEQAQRLARGEPLAPTPDLDSDALAALQQAADKMRTMTEARIHIVATERDLDQARRMYRQILPLQSTLEHGPLLMAGSCSPAAETGGDWWTYRRLSNGRVVLVIGDATGHGVHSAMIGCMAHGAVRALTQLGEDFLTPRRILDAVHHAIKVPGVEVAGMTLFACMIDSKAGNVQYFNHGHVFPLVCRRDASGVITDVSSITGERDLEEFGEDSIDMEVRSGTSPLYAGSVLVCFTDGLIERAKHGSRPFGARRLQQALLGAQVPSTIAGLTALRDRVLAQVDEYVEGAPLEDDITLVLTGINPAT
jgi:serine phosphatase RsbU (regulator of sigma subunit)